MVDEPSNAHASRLRRWRLVLGEPDGTGFDLRDRRDREMDRVLRALYSETAGDHRKGGLGRSAPSVMRWLDDIRTYFPSPVVQIMQRDAIERLNLRQLLLEPELLQSVEPDVHLVATILALKDVIPDKTRATARAVVRRVVEELEQKLAEPARQTLNGSLDRAARNRRPRLSEMDWQRTIRANLKHYQPSLRTIIPETRIGFGRRQRRGLLREVILCVDQSGSMAPSVIYASMLAAVMASIRSLRTSLALFDTSVVDLTEHLSDPVDVLFGVQLGGGTDIAQALAYVQSLVRIPEQTALVLISDLFEGGPQARMIRRVAELIASGVQVIVLLALSDEGHPSYNHEAAACIAALGAPCFACTPDRFADLMAAAIQRQDIAAWAASAGMVTVQAPQSLLDAGITA